ncbi:MAG: tripartite tricarboxylate transporter substrate binding protein [Hylemonella sp.]|uniref:Bug family tripartite tricarboxylate transporter substrate binding protein n=1 Tax=Hylemonella sp. TaxID=2066020 RepID=UPI0022C681D6|nr:tripartite tricarboxylate transporter substrate binding protein [Hylemonella sp.]MCZ8252440.1 tripartite tricarboxylate transporter substrate binding protein [Hylemonella sp.]
MRLIPSSPLRRALLALALTSLALGSQAAEPWPSKPVKLLVGFPAGTSPDLVARTLAEPLSKALGQPVVVENRPGAGGNIAADLVAKATDGHTLGVMINGNLTIAKLLNPKTPYDPAKDLAPISLIGTAPLVLSAPAGAPGSGTADWLAAARSSGSKWSYGSPGVGTVGHIGMELFKARTGAEPVHVPYPGYPQVVTAMVGGDIQLSMLPPGLAQAQAAAGKVRLLGVTSAGRSTLAPGVPSLSEAGVKDFQLEIWNAVAGPASLPKPVVAKLSALLSEIARSPEVRQRLYQQGWQVAGGSSEALARRIAADTAAMGRIIAERGIKVE